jgi:hypothetical protein
VVAPALVGDPHVHPGHAGFRIGRFRPMAASLGGDESGNRLQMLGCLHQEEAMQLQREWAEQVTKPKHDQVNHPKHYTSHPSGVECIEITRHMGYNLGNAVKYIWRCDLKRDAIEDLRKAIWYLQDELAVREERSK